MPSIARSPWRTISACLGLLLLTTSVAAASIPEARDTSPAHSIPKHLLRRQTTIDEPAYYEQVCGINFVDCGNQSCCTEGQECLVGTTSGEVLCRNLPGTTSTPEPSPSNTPSEESKPVPVAGIVGGVIGGVVVIAGLCVIYLLHRRAHPPITPSVPQAPFPNFPNHIEAKYPPHSDTASYSGDNCQPGSYFYNTRNRSASVASTRNAVSPTPYDNISPGGTNTYQSLGKPDVDTPNVVELPDSAVPPPMELPADGYFAEKPQPPPPPPPETNPDSTPQKPPSAFLQYLKKNRPS